MEYRDLFLQAVFSLRKNVLRTGLTMLGIIIGIAAVILIVSIGQGAVKYITDELSAFGTNFFSINPGSSAVTAIAGGQKNLTLDDADAIRNNSSLTNIQYVIPFSTSTVTVSANNVNKSILVYGTTDQSITMMGGESSVKYGDFLSSDDVQTSSRVVALGSDVVEDFFGKDANPIGETIRIDNKPFRIIGVFESTSTFFGGFFNKAVFIPIGVAINQISGQDAGLQEVDISVHNTELLNQTIQDVSGILRERHNIRPDEEDDFVTQSFQDALSTVQTVTTLLTLVVAAISGISLVVGGVGVMNIMLVTVTERTKEIGLLKAIGAKQKDILSQFLMESVVITLVGGGIGIAVGIGGAFLISLFAPIPFVISIPAIIIAVGVSVAVGVIFGLYPARRAARLSPIEALSYE